MPWENETATTQKYFLDRLNIFFIFVIISFIIIILKLAHLQLFKGKFFFRLSVENSTQLYIERAPRGTIFDSKGTTLCFNKPIPVVLFYPFVKKTKLSNLELTKIEKLIPKASQKISIAYSSGTTVYLADNVDRKTMFKLLEQQHILSGVSVNTELRRYYPYSQIASQLLGYVSEINQDELNLFYDKGYKQGDRIGKIGLEKEYDRYLRGKDGGIFIESDAKGTQLNIIEKVEPKQGNNLYLTIDIGLQKIAEEIFLTRNLSGAIVAIDPEDGAVKILASSPGYDPNKFVSGEPEIIKYISDEKLPMYNRVIQASYAPGSVFKVITALAGLNENIIDTQKEYNCNGYFTLGTKTFKCWEKKGHKRVSFMDGVRKSCDVYFYNIGLAIGVERIVNYAKEFGFYNFTGIDLPSEKKGFIPIDSWRKNRKWYDGDTVNISIGQGYLDVTPLQIAMMMSAVANKGILWKPYLVKKIIETEGKVVFLHKKTKLNTIYIKPEVWNLLHKTLAEVVNSGTGHGCYIQGVEIAGKTGTAENPHGKDHAWFSCYAPVNSPKIVLIVFVEHGGRGGAVAAPIAREILLNFFKERKL